VIVGTFCNQYIADDGLIPHKQQFDVFAVIATITEELDRSTNDYTRTMIAPHRIDGESYRFKRHCDDLTD
jgi:hypothetical protein